MHHHWIQLEAEKAFRVANRARRRTSFLRRLRGWSEECMRLPVYDETAARSSRPSRGRREIPVDAIFATTEPNRSFQFDSDFRPNGQTRARWQSVFLAHLRGAVLPPISVVQVGDSYAIRDGHHRVSVAKALGAVTIDAVVAA
jgi:ParB-like nuclease domain